MRSRPVLFCDVCCNFAEEPLKPEDSQCYEAARAGHSGAVAAVVDSLRPRLERMAAHYARCSREDADDLLQEAWIGLLEALGEVNLAIGSPDQYLIQCARWRLLDAIKRARVRRCASLDATDDGGSVLDAGELRLPPEMDGVLATLCVAEFAAGLKASQRAVLHCLMVGYTWREAGARLGCTSANIAYHVRQIKRQYEKWNDEGGPG